ncbi:MAG: rhodanese-like domain-containing protein [Hyphomonadaceae bacterium]
MFGGPKIPTESPEEIHAALTRGEIVLIDVREPREYATERIHGALLYPLSTFDPAALPQGGRPIVFHCGSGKRSGTAFELCQQAGVSVRSHMRGGIGAWMNARLPTISVDPATGQVRENR